MDEKLKKQIQFLIEVDKMKNIFRQTLISDKSRQENDAEHSWHFALMAMILFEYAPKDVDLSRVLKMALIHDLIEIYAGDVFAFDVKGNEEKYAREQASADKLFALLEPEQGQEIRDLWEEFEAMETIDAKYASAIDRIQPFIMNTVTDGHTWKKGNVCKSQVYKRMETLKQGAPKLWDFVEKTIEDAILKGHILPDESTHE